MTQVAKSTLGSTGLMEDLKSFAEVGCRGVSKEERLGKGEGEWCSYQASIGPLWTQHRKES